MIVVIYMNQSNKGVNRKHHEKSDKGNK